MSDNLYEDFFGFSSDLMLLLDLTGHILKVNRSFLKHMGYSLHEIIGRELASLTVDDDRKQLSAVLERIINSAIAQRLIVRCIVNEGASVRLDYTFHKSTKDSHILAVGRNLDDWFMNCGETCKDRKMVERLIEQKTHDLKQANAELDTFNFSISHDLRAPLRTMYGFSEVIEEDYGDRLDDTARDYLRRIRANCERMTMLTTHLLQLSRLNRQGMKFALVDMGQMADTIISDLHAAEPQRDVSFSRKGNMEVQGDRELLFILIQNLLDNAWKYTAARTAAEITFSESLMNGERIFSVVDNGIGFPNTEQEKLFVLFHRLHSPDEYEGIGIGLATAQRIVQRHNGRIWAESLVEGGAAFYFTLGNRGC